MPSVKTKNSFLYLSIAFCLSPCLAEEKPVRIKAEPVVVVATRIPGEVFQVGRYVTVISRSEIRSFPSRSVPELLKYCLGLDLQERGSFGVQADLSIRGSTFQQTLILVDGIRFNDLQTAHHNMDIPVSLEQIERIEILHGNGSSLYGPDAFGGVVNIVTRTPEKSHFSGGAGFYDHNTYSGGFGVDWKANEFLNSFSVEGKKSDGFMEERDFSSFNISNKFSFDGLGGTFELFAAHGEKDFGAYDFYTPGMNLPSREFTKTSFFKAGYERTRENFSFSQHLYYRSHFDRFVLNNDKPWLYRNETANSISGADMVLRIKNFAAGTDIAVESVKSSLTERHQNIRGALFAEFNHIILKRVFFNAGLRQDFHKTYGRAISPNVNITWWVHPDFKLRASAGHSFRAPSYTELYYQDPVNVGNQKLRPEKAWSYEIGFGSRLFQEIRAELSLFLRDEKDLIDWIKKPDRRWHAENIRSLKVKGLELGVTGDWRFFRFSLKNSFMGARQAGPSHIYKYGFRFPRNQAAFSLDFRPASSFSLHLHLVHKKRLGELAYSVLDAKIIKEFKGIGFFLEGNNLMNSRYEDIRGVAMPGRWVGGGIRLEF